MHDDDELHELLARAKPLHDMVRDIKPDDRWPYEPPAPDLARTAESVSHGGLAQLNTAALQPPNPSPTAGRRSIRPVNS